MAPREATIKRQNEKLKAIIGLNPSNNPVAIVAPERETAGSMAKACIRPIRIAIL